MEKEEALIDEALDTEIPPKPRKRGKRLNELEEAMRVAGMYPEDPDGKAGRGRGRGEGGKTERPWEEKAKNGRGKGRGRG